MMLFPINLWIFELKKNLSIPIGWSYFIGWLVFVLYVTCGEWPEGPRKEKTWLAGTEEVYREAVGGGRLAISRDNFLGIAFSFGLTSLATFFQFSKISLPHPFVISQQPCATSTINISGG